jgi:hypothetical protein
MALQHLFSENNSETLCRWLAAVQIGGRKLGEREREREREGEGGREIMGAAAKYEFFSRNC